MTILITRPLITAKRTALQFNAAGFETWVDPVLTVIPLPAIINSDAYDAIITTSTNGVESFAALTQRRDIPIFCAGNASSSIARDLGFQFVFFPSKAGGKALSNLIKESHFKHFAYIRGEIVKINMKHALASIPDVQIDTYVTYKTIPTAAWTDETIALFKNEKITAITFYSDYSTRVTLDLLKEHGLIQLTPFITALCLSDAITYAIREVRWKNIEIGSTTTELIANLLKIHKITMEQSNDNKFNASSSR